jgi:hypothetical protein
MLSNAKGYFLKEYGAWSVLIVSYLVGIGVSHTFAWTIIPLFLALALLINSKQAFMKRARKADDRKALAIFLGQIIVAAVIMIAIFRQDIPRLLPLLVFPATYLLLNKLAGEHFILTELMGFVLISLAAVLAKFLLTNGLDVRLLVGVALYFTAGVFKVKTLLLKKTQDRVLTVLYILFSALVYRRMHIPLIILLPLVDNLVVAATLYRVKLQTTGWIEVVKSLIFLSLFVYYY